LKAQETSLYVIGAAGSTIESGGFTLAYQVGEAIASTISDEGFVVNQGFMQSELQISTGISHRDLLTFHLYPNPASHQVMIDGLGVSTGQWRIVDLTGNLMQGGKESTITQENNFRIDISHLPPGFYLLHWMDSSGFMYKPASFVKY